MATFHQHRELALELDFVDSCLQIMWSFPKLPSWLWPILSATVHVKRGGLRSIGLWSHCLPWGLRPEDSGALPYTCKKGSSQLRAAETSTVSPAHGNSNEGFSGAAQGHRGCQRPAHGRFQSQASFLVSREPSFSSGVEFM